MNDLENDRPALIAAADALADLPKVQVQAEVARAVQHGAAVTAGALGAGQDGMVRVVGDEGDLLAVYRVAGGKAKPEVVLA
jgi:tRNA U55 pseudouridine synthase TruB